MSPDLLCVGHATRDLVMCLDRFPLENSKTEIRESIASGGGPAANAAYLAALWGVSTGFAGLVGDDVHGHAIRDEFEGAGVDVSLLEMRPGQATPFSVILVNAGTGSRTIINRKAPGAAYHLEGSALAALRPKCLLFDGHEWPAAREALELWPDAVSILDAGSAREGTLELAGRVDYLIASERFALQATGEASLVDSISQGRVLAELRRRYPVKTVVTLGERGLITEEEGRLRRRPAFPVKAVDTTGAGDIFHGAFAHGCVTGLDDDSNLRRASMAAALSVQIRGGRPSIPSLRAVEEALRHAH